MSGQYTLNSFVRQASNSLLADFLHTKSVDLGVDLKKIKPRDCDPIIVALDGLSDEQRAGLDQDFMAVMALANKAGLQQILEEGRYRKVDIHAGIDAQNSLLNKAFWVFLHYRPVFDGAAQFAVSHARGRYWKRHLPVASAPGIDPTPSIASLETALSKYFRAEEGRGRACKIDYRARNPHHFFHAFPEDFPDAPLAWSPAGLQPHPLRPAFEIMFVYNEVEGTLDIYFEGSKRTVERLWQLFAATVLGIEDLPKPSKPSFGLESMKAPTTAFVRPEASPIADIRIKGLQFRILNTSGTVISVETNVNTDPNAIHAAVSRTFAVTPGQSGRFALSQARVIGVTLQASIDSGDRKKPRSRTFHLSETSCSLKYEGADLLLRRMLVDSGIDRTVNQAGADAEPTRPFAERRAG